MKQKHILKYIISSFFLFIIHWTNAQEIVENDTIKPVQTYGIRLGVDISRPIIQSIQKEDLGFEITVDYRVKKNWYAALEMGFESEPGTEDYFKYHTKGNYAKIGFNYNAYENWEGMNNEVYLGLRYGYSKFSQELVNYTFAVTDDYFGNVSPVSGTLYNGLTAQWVELHLGIKVEVMKNLYLSTGIEFKKLITEKAPESFANLYIPGFQRVYLNKGGVGFNYTISYLIPLLKK